MSRIGIAMAVIACYMGFAHAAPEPARATLEWSPPPPGNFMNPTFGNGTAVGKLKWVVNEGWTATKISLVARHNTLRIVKVVGTYAIPAAKQQGGEDDVTGAGLYQGGNTLWCLMEISHATKGSQLISPQFRSAMVGGSTQAPQAGGTNAWSATLQGGGANPTVAAGQVTAALDVSAYDRSGQGGYKWSYVKQDALSLTALPRNGGVVYQDKKQPGANPAPKVEFVLTNMLPAKYDLIGILGLEALGGGGGAVTSHQLSSAFKEVDVP